MLKNSLCAIGNAAETREPLWDSKRGEKKLALANLLFFSYTALFCSFQQWLLFMCVFSIIVQDEAKQAYNVENIAR